MEAKSYPRLIKRLRRISPLFITYTIMYTITCAFIFYFGVYEARGGQDSIGEELRPEDSGNTPLTPRQSPLTGDSGGAADDSANGSESAAAAAATEGGSDDVRQYTVVKGDTIYKLCVKHYTTCKSRELELIKEYNPALTNIDHIQVGQVIRFPVVTPETDANAKKERERQKEAVRDTAKEGAKEHGLEQASITRESRGAARAYGGAYGGASLCRNYDRYPNRLDGSIDRVEWLSAGRARVYGHINVPAESSGGEYKFYVSVPGDLDYEQPMVLGKDGAFSSDITVGRAGKDYGVDFGLKLAKVYGDIVVSDITRHIVKDPSKTGVEYFKAESLSGSSGARSFTGQGGVAEWVRMQSLDAGLSDNPSFKVKDGIFVKNYRYISA
ncbi:MAG: LysM peptidoglycan-binding domain-containing protein, partial [Nitrospirae bacterium]|nr:LysM peptidoglycan-binding domain-containing protein [Nitrospirota bacterium]